MQLRAGPFAAHMALDGEAARRVVQLLADVLADALHLAAAGTRRVARFVVSVHTRQMSRQRGALGPLGRGLGGLALGGHQLGQLRIQRGEVSIDRLVEERLLLGVELLALLAELHAAQLRYLEGQLLDPGVAPLDLVAVIGPALQERLYLGADVPEPRDFQRGDVFGTEGCGDCHDDSVGRARVTRIGESTDCVTAGGSLRHPPHAATAGPAPGPAIEAASAASAPT